MWADVMPGMSVPIDHHGAWCASIEDALHAVAEVAAPL